MSSLKASGRMRVTIAAHRQLRIYNPDGLEQPVITGRTELIGEKRRIRGNEWLIFPSQRRFGLPIKRWHRADDRIEADLEEAAFFGDVTVEDLAPGMEKDAAA